MVSKTSLRIAAIQMISEPEIPENLTRADLLIERAVDQGASLVALPENFAIMTGDDSEKIRKAERPGDGAIQDFLAATAQRHKIYLVGGTIPLRTRGGRKVRNATLAFSPEGKLVARYDKMHLFGFDNGTERYSEKDSVEAGDSVVTFDTPLGKVGMSICYDIRFPELFRTMRGVDLIVVPAAFTYPTGLAHWEVLLRARAIENQCYVLASAQGGKHSWGRVTYGDTMIVDPWGSVLTRLAEGPGLVVTDFDRELLERVRIRLPALEHRRLA